MWFALMRTIGVAAFPKIMTAPKADIMYHRLTGHCDESTKGQEDAAHGEGPSQESGAGQRRGSGGACGWCEAGGAGAAGLGRALANIHTHLSTLDRAIARESGPSRRGLKSQERAAQFTFGSPVNRPREHRCVFPVLLLVTFSFSLSLFSFFLVVASVYFLSTSAWIWPRGYAICVGF